MCEHYFGPARSSGALHAVCKFNGEAMSTLEESDGDEAHDTGTCRSLHVPPCVVGEGCGVHRDGRGGAARHARRGPGDSGAMGERTVSGKFNVRLGPDLHKRVALEAVERHESVNTTVIKRLGLGEA